LFANLKHKAQAYNLNHFSDQQTPLQKPGVVSR